MSRIFCRHLNNIGYSSSCYRPWPWWFEESSHSPSPYSNFQKSLNIWFFLFFFSTQPLKLFVIKLFFHHFAGNNEEGNLLSAISTILSKTICLFYLNNPIVIFFLGRFRTWVRNEFFCSRLWWPLCLWALRKIIFLIS